MTNKETIRNSIAIVGCILLALLIAGLTGDKAVLDDTLDIVLGTKVDTTNSEPIDESNALVIRIVDGDTIELENGQKVRYIGVNTPESVDPRRIVECFGKEASAKNSEFVLNKRVRLEKDVSETDKYGRLLRYVYVGNMFVNAELVKEGYAYASSYPPDVKYQDEFNQLQKEAEAQNRGLWKACD